MEKEQESLMEQIRETEEKIFRVQTNKGKEVSSLRQQAQIIEQTLA